MNIPNQLSLRDWINYFLIGLIILLVFVFFSWHFFNIDLSNLQATPNILESVVFFTVSYITGQLLSGTLFSYLLKASIDTSIDSSPNQKKIQYFIAKLIFGLKAKPDSRVTPFSDSKNLRVLTEKRISSLLSLDLTKLSKSEKKEVFYIIMRYLEIQPESDVISLERFQIKTNLMSSIATISLLILILNTAAILIKYTSDIGALPLMYLTAIELVFIVILRISSNLFQKYLLLWWKNIWRTFLSIAIYSPPTDGVHKKTKPKIDAG